MNFKKVFFIAVMLSLLPSLVFAMGQQVPQNPSTAPQPPGPSVPTPQNPGPNVPTPQPGGGGSSAPLPIGGVFDCPPTTGSQPPCLVEILQTIIGRLLLIVYPVLAGVIFYGGFQMMFSGGNSEKYKAGLKTIKYAVIGFVVIILSQGIASILYSLVTL